MGIGRKKMKFFPDSVVTTLQAKVGRSHLEAAVKTNMKPSRPPGKKYPMVITWRDRWVDRRQRQKGSRDENRQEKTLTGVENSIS